MVSSQSLTLLLTESSISEHSNLINYMLPVLSRSFLLKIIHKLLAHINNTVRHRLDVPVPLLLELRISKNSFYDSCAVEGWVGVHWPSEDFELGKQSVCLLCIFSDDAEKTHTLSIQSKVLCEGLAKHYRNSTVYEIAKGRIVPFNRATCEALIRHIEKGQMSPPLYHLFNLTPLLKGGVGSRWVMGAGVEQDYRTFWGTVQISEEAVYIDAFKRVVVVGVFFELEPRVLSHIFVVPPGGCRKVHCF